MYKNQCVNVVETNDDRLQYLNIPQHARPEYSRACYERPHLLHVNKHAAEGAERLMRVQKEILCQSGVSSTVFK